MIHAPSIIVPKKLGEKAIKTLSALALLDDELRIHGNGQLSIPLKRSIGEEELEVLRKSLPKIVLGETDFQERKRRPRALLEALWGKLPPHLLASLPRSMDLIGQVAIVGIPPELEVAKSLIGKAVLDVNRHVETVLAKTGPVGGELRLREYSVIAGFGKTETTYKEYGCSYILDPTKVYFSPRLSTERWRVAQKAKKGETIIDMFAGVGPFSILIAKVHKEVTVYALDLNPIAIQYLERNIALNKVQSSVIPILGDSKEIMTTRLAGVAHRVIMNLPEMALIFMATACQALRPQGGTIHYYAFKDGSRAVLEAERELYSAVEQAGRKVLEVESSHLVREVAPRMWQVAVDVCIG